MTMLAASGEGRARVVAVLGPTNTGKTHLAMERMLGNESGILGFPLRLLARENYERAVAAKGARYVALITGEEKILPPDARYFLCTVEAMPLDRRVAFVGVDEIQLCADPDRGHVFTERLLQARGTVETAFMGAETMRPLLKRLLPDAEYIGRPRFSTLRYAGPCRLSRLPPRTAIVAFNVTDVYTIAELIRRERGGAAVVLGALSPRTRNAQVAMYQAGEVDYLVATDAIGMGLNMNVDHVAFASIRKFDGRRPRTLSASELAQIAGRAGRHTKDGTFGTTGEVGPIDPDVAERIESHRFDALSSINWRNNRLAYTSIDALQRSLARRPEQAGLVRAREADDELVLAALARERDIADAATTVDAVRLLWDVCQIPDFGNVRAEGQARYLGQIFRFLAGIDGGSGGRLPADWVARQVDRLNRLDGDIETLMQRIAGIRTWTYLSHRGCWLDNAAAWQERTRKIEDKLSDALHERLIQRFVDRRTAFLVGRLKDRQTLTGAVSGDGSVLIEGHFVGTLDGFRFRSDPLSRNDRQDTAGRAIAQATQRTLASEVARRITRMMDDAGVAFTLASDGMVRWQGEALAELRAGRHPHRPRVEVIASDLLDPAARDRVRKRLQEWLDAHVADRLSPLFLADRMPLSPAARGLLFQVAERLGSMARAECEPQVAAIDETERQRLRDHGLKLGRESIFFPALLKPAAIDLRRLLWTVAAGDIVPPDVDGRRTSVAATKGRDTRGYEAVGYLLLGTRAVRCDIAERLAAMAAEASRRGPFTIDPRWASLMSCGLDAVADVLTALGYRRETRESGFVMHAPRPRRHLALAATGHPRVAAPTGHPGFAALRQLSGTG